MDKNAIKKFAVWARTELIARVSLKGVEYGITEDSIEDANADSVGGKVLTADEKKQRLEVILLVILAFSIFLMIANFLCFQQIPGLR